MKYDDLEKTKDLFDIADIPSPIENIEMEGVNKDYLSSDEDFTLGLSEKEEPRIPIEDKKIKKNKKSLKEKWQNLPKKKKIIFIVSGIIILLVIVGLILFFCLRKEETKPEEPKEPEAPTVIVEKENYIYKDGTLSFLDTSGNEIGTYECKNKEEDLCFVENYSDTSKLDGTKTVYEDGSAIPVRTKIYNNKYVFIYDNSSENEGVITLYNIEEQKSEGTYTEIKGYDDSDYVILKNNNNKYGAIEFTESGIKEKIAFSFENLDKLKDSKKVVALTNKKYFIYNTDGKIESKGLAYEIRSYNDNYIVAFNDGYYIYDYKGNLVIDESYDYASLLDDYVVLISDQKLYIKDYKNNKYNEEGIKLSNSDYNVTNVYNSDKVLQETKKAYDVAIEGSTLTVTYMNKNTEKTETINLDDGKLSSNLTNLNYFNGKLYFYSDTEETKLIGSYACENKNVINKDTKTLSNCLIASDSSIANPSDETMGTIPLFNERYVFILDALDIKNPTIVLYDLKNNKTLSKYAKVDTGSYTKDNKVTFKTTSATYVIGENKSNKYGVIKIAEDVKGVIAFNYKNLSKIRDYYVGEESTGTYVMLDTSGKEITSKYGYKIVDYKGKNLKVVDNDNKYYVYDFSGNKIEESGYLDITLEDDYYVVVTTDNKLDIHRYDNTSFKLSPEGSISVNGAGDYEVKPISTGYSIKVKSTGATYKADMSGNLATTEE